MSTKSSIVLDALAAAFGRFHTEIGEKVKEGLPIQVADALRNVLDVAAVQITEVMSRGDTDSQLTATLALRFVSEGVAQIGGTLHGLAARSKPEQVIGTGLGQATQEYALNG
jgi:hypothetical protein